MDDGSFEFNVTTFYFNRWQVNIIDLCKNKKLYMLAPVRNAKVINKQE